MSADQVLANAQAEGKQLKMECGLAVADVLQPVPPFQEVRKSFFPEVVRRDFARIAGVENHFVYETDVGKNNAWERSDTPRL